MIFEGPYEHNHSLENFRIIRNVFGNLRTSSEVFESSRVLAFPLNKSLTPLSQKKLAGIKGSLNRRITVASQSLVH